MKARRGRSVPACGTVRRVRALVANGWPLQRLAAESGLSARQLSRLLRSVTVPLAVVRAVGALYSRLCLADPIEHGVTAAVVRRSKVRAAAARWAPVGAWDDHTIDDPAAFPDWTGNCGRIPGFNAHAVYGIPVCGPCLRAAELRQQRATARALRAA